MDSRTWSRWWRLVGGAGINNVLNGRLEPHRTVGRAAFIIAMFASALMAGCGDPRTDVYVTNESDSPYFVGWVYRDEPGEGFWHVDGGRRGYTLNVPGTNVGTVILYSERCEKLDEYSHDGGFIAVTIRGDRLVEAGPRSPEEADGREFKWLEEGGCRQVALRTRQPEPPGDPCPAALLAGVLIEHEGSGIALADPAQQSPSVPVVWPNGYSARVEGDRVALVDAAGRVLAYVGDEVEIGGGMTEDGGTAWHACGDVKVVAEQ